MPGSGIAVREIKCSGTPHGSLRSTWATIRAPTSWVWFVHCIAMDKVEQVAALDESDVRKHLLKLTIEVVAV